MIRIVWVPPVLVFVWTGYDLPKDFAKCCVSNTVALDENYEPLRTDSVIAASGFLVLFRCPCFLIANGKKLSITRSMDVIV